MIRPFGGEPPFQDRVPHLYTTDSGRSSLRLILEDPCFSTKRYLLPDYLCGTVLEVLDQYGVVYDFYAIGDGLRWDPEEINRAKYDVLYAIDYFGWKQDLSAIALKPGSVLLEDGVFLPYLEPPDRWPHWIGFNSLRKISPLPDGSMVWSTVPLVGKKMEGPASFVSLKVRGQRKKAAFLAGCGGCEKDYLADLQHGETLLNRQQSIHAPSSVAVGRMMDFYRKLEVEYSVRRAQFAVYEQALGRFVDRDAPEYPCFYPLLLEDRDAVRAALALQQIYLPAHWPELEGVRGEVQRRMLALPLDGRFSASEVQRLVEILVRMDLQGAAV
ncbi:MAG: hypothetical protein HQL53_00975 [Magnetococcales bacterium]|nr:hypothetical protein [Magnetococcales bacterium]